MRTVTTASGNNRQNTQGVALPSVTGRSTQQIANIVPAGQSIQVPASGSFFYFTVCTATLKVRPQTGGGVGAFSDYGQGQGLDVGVESAFSCLEIKNETALAVVFQMCVGYDGFIDNTLILNQTTGQKVVAISVQDSLAANNILIPDLSGTVITDTDGGEWYALSRVAFGVSNADAAAVYSIQNTAANKTLCFVQPLATIRQPWGGNFRLSEAGAINAVVWDEYNAIPKV